MKRINVSTLRRINASFILLRIYEQSEHRERLKTYLRTAVSTRHSSCYVSTNNQSTRMPLSSSPQKTKERQHKEKEIYYDPITLSTSSNIIHKKSTIDKALLLYRREHRKKAGAWAAATYPKSKNTNCSTSKKERKVSADTNLISKLTARRERNRTEQNGTEKNGTEQNRTEQNRTI